jgi:hypothetical protein
LPDSVTSIGHDAFYDCIGLTSITLPTNLTSIERSMFYNCTGLTSITLPTNLTSIGDSAFSGCTSLTSITLPANLTSIGTLAFRDCGSLTSISVTSGNRYYVSENGVLFNYDKSVLINYPVKNNRKNYTIPSSVTSVEPYAFKGCSDLTAVTLPDNLTNIGISAFYGCTALEQITLPDSVTSIGNSAFYGCSKLTLSDPALPAGLMSIEQETFSGCTALEQITLPNSVTSIGNSAFSGCSGLTSVTLPTNLTSIGGSAFSDCTKLTLSDPALPAGLTSIGSGAFSGCRNLTSITLPAGLQSIGFSAFLGCTGLTEIVLPVGITNLGSAVFSGTGISKIRVPATVTTMSTGDFGLFHNMQNLTEIVFEHGMEEIPVNALKGTFRSAVEVHVPMSVAFGADEAGLTTSMKLYGVEGSYIIDWASKNHNWYVPIEGTITNSDAEHAWLNVPYQYIIKTGTYKNAHLEFEVVDESKLPDGLTLLPDGQFHGAPTETGEFVFEVKVYYSTYGYLLDFQQITLTVEEPVGKAGDDALAESNDYPIADFIGTSQDESGEGLYLLATTWGAIDLQQTFRIEDNDPDDSDAPKEDNFQYFNGFWLDGKPLTPYPFVHGATPDPDNDNYEAESGSTVITAYAETFKQLENGEHTIAAEFMIPASLVSPDSKPNNPDVQKVAAQKFTLDLTERPTTDPEPNPDPGDGDDDDKGDPDPGDDKGDPDPGDDDDDETDDGKPGGNDNGNTKPPNETDTPDETPTVPDTGDENGGGDKTGNDETPGNTETPGDTTGPGDNEDNKTGNDETPGNTETPGDTTEPEDNPASPPGNTDNDETPENVETPGNTETPAGTNPPNNTSPSRDAGSADGAGAPIAARASNTAQTAPSGPDADANANEAPQTAPAAPPDIVTLVGEAADAGPAAGAGTNAAEAEPPGGLTREADGSLTYALDGSGAPFELRIDIAFTEFRGLSFDGVPWERGTDYKAREGSTILTIAAERLEGYATGIHTISAVFENETVEIEFLLQKSESAVAGTDNGNGATAPASVEDMQAKGPGAGTIAAIALAVLLVLAAAFMLLRARRRAAA